MSRIEPQQGLKEESSSAVSSHQPALIPISIQSEVSSTFDCRLEEARYKLSEIERMEKEMDSLRSEIEALASYLLQKQKNSMTTIITNVTSFN